MLTANKFDDTLKGMAQHMPLYCVIAMSSKYLDGLIEKHKKIFPWHHNDTLYSYSYEARKESERKTYSYRMHVMFKDQFTHIAKNNNSLICTWDTKNDIERDRKPCLILIKIFKEKNVLHCSVVFRNRDVLRRMIGNWAAIREKMKWFNEKYYRGRYKLGNIYDFSMQAFYRQDDYKKWIGRK